ncbi:Tar ligand binding domain-containing protein [Halomonas sp. ISL-60]|uniref:methyl-accepting chemotaxis protein n=1 Tax=Halomonas sp. ISL-56 TaxID=2819149 RepID=UPI001BE8C313|nr:methyl-accepting chemotaxis protein [Halomonas sp. ISL-56]MBT2772960.1 Tar ligand binding domain-containing protein [Halomonas sp. ISL-60]MBT2800877.1 Tar ligand binding domain-containing protein [Halomonas sp. ISL-56]
MQNISVKKVIAGALIVLLAMIIVLGSMGVMEEREAAQLLSEINEISAQQASAANRAETNLMEVRVRLERMSQHYRVGNINNAERALGEARQSLEKSDQRIAELTKLELPSSSERRPLIDAIVDSYNLVVTDTLREDLANARYEALDEYRDPINQKFSSFSTAINNFNNYALSRGNQVHSEAQRDSVIFGITVGVLILAAIVLYIVVQIMINRLVINPLQRAVRICENVAKGDLTSHIEGRGSNEIGRLYSAMEDMQERLEEMIGTLNQSSEAVASSSKQIASGSQDLASRTEQQAAALQQTAASMDEISSIVRQNADTAGQAQQLTQDAAQQANTGKQASERTSLLMRELEETSHKVHDIVQVIDSIAFQTNILALNASVEAARAGEHGRGFAVVASEVRSLATKTSTSSKEIRTMIEDISQRIVVGAEQAAKNGHDMAEINEAIRKVTEMMQELALAAKEQEMGISQVSTAVSQMDSATQENVSLVEETSTASASLQDEATRLAELVTTFKLKHATNSGTASPAITSSQPAAAHRSYQSRPLPSATPDWEAF